MTTLNLGKVQPLWKGVFAELTPYLALDFVTHNNIIYMCTQPSIGNLPTDINFWRPLIGPIGSAAAANLTLSPIDFVSNRVLKVGDSQALLSRITRSEAVLKLDLNNQIFAEYEPNYGTTFKPLVDAFNFSSATGGSYINPTGLIKEGLPNQPRITYTDGVAGLALRGATTNYLKSSSEFTPNRAYWYYNETYSYTVAANSEIAPDGTMTADKFISVADPEQGRAAYDGPATDNYYPIILQDYDIGKFYTVSIYAKPAEITKCGIRLVINSAHLYLYSATFDLTTGTLINTSFPTDYVSIKYANITKAANGYYRCSITFENPWVGAVEVTFHALPDEGSNFPYPGGEGLILNRAQLEQAAYPSEPITTTTTAVTRAADELTKLLTTADYWVGINEDWSVYVEFSVPWTRTGSVHKLVTIGDSYTTNTKFQLGISADGRIFTNFNGGSILQTTQDWDKTARVKVLVTHTANELSLYVAGDLIGTSGAITSIATTCDYLGIGNEGGSFRALDGILYAFDLYPNALNLAEASALTITI